MEDLIRRVRQVLAIYLERGRQAVSALEAGRYDEAREILRRRNAAFHNLRAVDALALENGHDAARDEQVLAIWEEIRNVDVDLARELNRAQLETRKLAQQIRDVRFKIGKYRAGVGDAASFTKTA